MKWKQSQKMLCCDSLRPSSWPTAAMDNNSVPDIATLRCAHNNELTDIHGHEDCLLRVYSFKPIPFSVAFFFRNVYSFNPLFWKLWVWKVSKTFQSQTQNVFETVERSKRFHTCHANSHASDLTVTLSRLTRRMSRHLKVINQNLLTNNFETYSVYFSWIITDIFRISQCQCRWVSPKFLWFRSEVVTLGEDHLSLVSIYSKLHNTTQKTKAIMYLSWAVILPTNPLVLAQNWSLSKLGRCNPQVTRLRVNRLPARILQVGCYAQDSEWLHPPTNQGVLHMNNNGDLLPGLLFVRKHR